MGALISKLNEAQSSLSFFKDKVSVLKCMDEYHSATPPAFTLLLFTSGSVCHKEKEIA